MPGLLSIRCFLFIFILRFFLSLSFSTCFPQPLLPNSLHKKVQLSFPIIITTTRKVLFSGWSLTRHPKEAPHYAKLITSLGNTVTYTPARISRDKQKTKSLSGRKSHLSRLQRHRHTVIPAEGAVTSLPPRTVGSIPSIGESSLTQRL